MGPPLNQDHFPTPQEQLEQLIPKELDKPAAPKAPPAPPSVHLPLPTKVTWPEMALRIPAAEAAERCFQNMLMSDPWSRERALTLWTQLAVAVITADPAAAATKSTRGRKRKLTDTPPPLNFSV